MLTSVLRIALFMSGLVLTSLSGCSLFGGSYDEEYRDSASLPPLDVPPDLTRPDWNNRMAIPEQAEGTVSAVETARRESAHRDGVRAGPVAGAETDVLPEYVDMRIMRDGNVRWLRVDTSTQALWPKLGAFWKELGVPVARDEPKIGIMETDWFDVRQNLPPGAIQGMFSKIANYVYDAGVRERYHLRIEREGDEVASVYLTQQRAEQVGEQDDASLHWEMRAADPDKEAEMLRRLMVFLGASQEQVSSQVVALKKDEPVASLQIRLEEGIPILYVDDEFANVWRRVGVALDRAGLYVEQQDRSNGVYYFTYTEGENGEREGFLSRLFGGGSGLEVNERYEVHVLEQGAKTLITAHNDSEKNKQLKREGAEIILKRLRAAYTAGRPSA